MKIRIVTAGLTAALLAGWAQGANCVWSNGTGNGLWTTAANWTNNAVPGSSDYAWFDDTKVGSSTLNSNLTILNYRCYSTTGTQILILGATNTLTINGNSASFAVAVNTSNSNVIVSNGAVRFTGSSSLLLGLDNSSNWKPAFGTLAFRNTLLDFSNAKGLQVAYSFATDGNRRCGGVMDLSEAVIASGSATNTLKFIPYGSSINGLFVGFQIGQGTLKLPPAVTNIDVGEKLNLGGLGYMPGTSLIDLGVNPQLKQIRVQVDFLNYFGDFTYSDGVTTYRGLPPGVDLYVGTSSKWGQLYMAFGSTLDLSQVQRQHRVVWGGFNRFEVYLRNLLIGHTQYASYHYTSAELDLSQTPVVRCHGSDSDFFVPNVLGVGQFVSSGLFGGQRSHGSLKLPPSITSMTTSNFLLGGIASTNASFIQFGTNAFNKLTVYTAFYFFNGNFQYLAPNGATNAGFSSSGITLKLGASAQQRAAMEVGRHASGAAYVGEATLAGVTNLEAWLHYIQIGRNTGYWSEPATGTVDLRGANLNPLNVTGTVQLCHASNSRGFLYLAEGTATVGNVAMALNNTNAATLWMSNLVLTVTNSFQMGRQDGVACVATVTNIVAGKPSGIDLQVANTNNLVIQNTGVMKVIFQAEPLEFKKPCWGLRMAGDQTAFFAQMIAAGRLTWQTPGLSASSMARLGVFYEDGNTYFGIKPGFSGTLMQIR
jgi:hypothetical protein